MSARLAAFLAPRSIALVGVPGDLARPGARPLVFLLKHGYRGRIFPVNPRRAEIGGLRAYPALADLPERPDTVWVGVPGPEVLGVLQEAGRLRIPNAVILTAGFGETGADGRRREQALQAAAARDGITVLGPNMLGFINFWDRIPLTFSAAGGLDRLLAGGLGVVSQSGALAGAVVNRADDRLVGMSAMVSTGNEAGITLAECLEYFADDPRTHVVAMIAEGIRDGARFRSAAARLLEAGKPLVALKVGRSEAGRRNALTHTGALAGSHAAWRAVARQLGIIEVDTFEDMVEIAGFHARERRPVTGRVGVLTTSGGASIMTADQLEARGLRMPRLSAPTVAGLAALLPEHARTRDNPVDVTAGMPEATFEKVLATLVADPGLDVLITAVTGAAGVERAQSVVRVARAADTPVVACWLGGSQTEDGLRVLDAEGVPAFRNPRTAAAALASARDVAAARGAPAGVSGGGEGRRARRAAQERRGRAGAQRAERARREPHRDAPASPRARRRRGRAARAAHGAPRRGGAGGRHPRSHLWADARRRRWRRADGAALGHDLEAAAGHARRDRGHAGRGTIAALARGISGRTRRRRARARAGGGGSGASGAGAGRSPPLARSQPGDRAAARQGRRRRRPPCLPGPRSCGTWEFRARQSSARVAACLAPKRLGARSGNTSGW